MIISEGSLYHTACYCSYIYCKKKQKPQKIRADKKRTIKLVQNNAEEKDKHLNNLGNLKGHNS